MMATHELVVPKSMPITGPETFPPELKRAPYAGDDATRDAAAASLYVDGADADGRVASRVSEEEADADAEGMRKTALRAAAEAIIG